MIREKLRFSNGHLIGILRRYCPNRILTEARNEITVVKLSSWKIFIFRNSKEMKLIEAKK